MSNPILFSTFYNKIRTDIVLYLQTNPQKEEYGLFIQTISNIFKEKFTRQLKPSILIDSIHNNLIVYLEMVSFIQDNQKPFMRQTIDTTDIISLFNRFYYLYSLHVMNDKCEFSSDIYTIIHSYLT